MFDPTAFVNLADVEHAARERLSPMARAYYSGGARDRVALRENRTAWERLAIHYRVLADVSQRSMVTALLGQELSLPVLAAPTAFQRLAHPDGELAVARAMAAAGSIMVLSSLSTTAVEAVCAQGRTWFQLYVYRDRGATAALVARAEAAGCTALVFTVDAPVLGCREDDVRGGFHLPAHLKMENITATGAAGVPAVAGESGLSRYVADFIDPAISWETLRWLSGITHLPVLVKGICRGDDAERAMDCGAAGVMVSNHGGRALESTRGVAEVLPEIAEAVEGRCVITAGGGVRTGFDVLKMLALGADAVLVGRDIIRAAVGGGAQGVRLHFDYLASDLRRGMLLTGSNTLSDIGSRVLDR